MQNTTLRPIAILFAILFSACGKNNDPAPAGKVYNDAKGTSIIVSSVSWYLITQGNGGEVHIKIAGTTNAGRLVLTTYGDGLQTDINIDIDNNHRFSEDAVMSFSATSRQTDTFQENALVTAYKGSDTLKATLPSGNLHY